MKRPPLASKLHIIFRHTDAFVACNKVKKMRRAILFLAVLIMALNAYVTSTAMANQRSKQSSQQIQTQRNASTTSNSSSSSKKDESTQQRSQQERPRLFFSLEGDTTLSTAMEFLGKFYDDCQPIAGRESQSASIECSQRCSSDQNATTDPRASGGNGASRTTTIFGKCNGRQCLLISYSRRADGSLDIHHGGFHPDNTDAPPGLRDKTASLSRSIDDAITKRKAWEKDCEGASNCVVDADGHGTPTEGTFCDASSACFGLNGGSYTVFIDEDGEMDSCGGVGCADFEELEAAHEWEKAVDQAEAETADVDPDDNPDDPEDEDCSRMSEGDDSGCSRVSGIVLAAYDFFKQKNLREEIQRNRPSNIDPSPIDQPQALYRTRLNTCPGESPRRGPREMPREDRNRCQTYEVSMNTEGEVENCNDGKISPEKGKPKGRKGRPPSQGGGRVDPSPL